MLLQRLAARSSRLFAPAASRLLSPAAAAPILFTRGLAYHNRVQPFRAPQKWRWEPEPGQVAGAPHSNERPRPLYPGQKSLLRKLDEARIKRGEKPRNLVKTRKRIAHARHTHIARFRMRGRGPSPREKQVWEDPEQATRDAMIQFVDPYELDPDLAAPGRRWHAAEIRLKSNEDLQKLWVVLLKERNMLHSTRMLHKKRKTEMPHRGRIRDVRKSMAMIKVVLNERQVEKRARDMRIKHELHRERALDQIDFEGSTVWPPFIPNSERRLPLAQRFTFNVILRTADGEVPSVRPEPTNLGLEMYVDGEKIPDAKFDQHIVLRPHVPRRPEELSYACHVMIHGDALPKDRFLASATSLRGDGAPVEAELRATLYDEAEVGGGTVPVFLTPSKRLKKRVAMADINERMSEALRRAREEAAKEAGVELPAPSPSPPPTEYWKGTLNPPLQ